MRFWYAQDLLCLLFVICFGPLNSAIPLGCRHCCLFGGGLWPTVNGHTSRARQAKRAREWLPVWSKVVLWNLEMLYLEICYVLYLTVCKLRFHWLCKLLFCCLIVYKLRFFSKFFSMSCMCCLFSQNPVEVRQVKIGSIWSMAILDGTSRSTSFILIVLTFLFVFFGNTYRFTDRFWAPCNVLS